MRSDNAYLEHIRDAISAITEFTSDGREAFLASKLIQDAVIRNLEVIGEATKNLSESSKAEYPQIQWKQIAGMRDVLIHHYFGVQLEFVWATTENDLGPLLQAVVTLLARP